MSYQLYHAADTRSFRALWALEEVGATYDLHLLPFPPRVKAPDYLGINPLGTVPLLIDGSARMVESVAICQYLAARHPDCNLAVAPGSPDFAAYLDFLHFGEAALTFPQALMLRYGQFETPLRRQPQVVADYERWLFYRLTLVEQRLETAAYLVENRFSMADISVGYAVKLTHHVGIDNKLPPSVRTYFDRLQSRPAFIKATHRQATLG